MERLIRVSKVTSNNDAPMLYIPKEARKIAGIERGDLVLVYVDEEGRIILKKLKLNPEGRNANPLDLRRRDLPQPTSEAEMGHE